MAYLQRLGMPRFEGIVKIDRAYRDRDRPAFGGTDRAHYSHRVVGVYHKVEYQLFDLGRIAADVGVFRQIPYDDPDGMPECPAGELDDPPYRLVKLEKLVPLRLVHGESHQPAYRAGGTLG